MKISEEDRGFLAAQAPGLDPTLDTTLDEASRLFSPGGLRQYLAGARALAALGKEPSLVEIYLQALPQVARECGEEVVEDSVGAVMRLASMTSGEVLALVFATLPIAAARLGDLNLVRAYLQLLHRTAAKAPRGLRPMLEHLDELLRQLTVSGLGRWADFGAETHRRDPARQSAYFALQSQDSLAVLQRERRGTLLINSQRRLSSYLRALWGRDFPLRPLAAQTAHTRPFLEDEILSLPDAVDDIRGRSGFDLYRAMAAHLAAHQLYAVPLPDAALFSPSQRFLIGVMEDARVEARAWTLFPGLRQLWRSLMPEGLPPPEHPGLDLIERCALALLDPACLPGDPELEAIATRFHAAFAQGQGDLSLPLGLALHEALAKRQAVPSVRLLETLRIPYRDDNRCLWIPLVPGPAASAPQVRRRVGLMEFINECDVETAGDDAQEIWVLRTELFPYEDEGISYNQRDGKPAVSDPVLYPEWDYRTQRYRPQWVSVSERRPPAGDPTRIDTVLSEHRGVGHQIKRLIDRLRPHGATRQRKLEDGDVLDLNAAVEAMVDLRLGFPPDPRITQRIILHRRDLCVLVLLDLSASTNERVRGDDDKTVLDLSREAATLLATALEGIGDPYALHGFASNGRHDVRYSLFKGFEQRFDDQAKSRLAGMSGDLSTRMGAALRHAGAHLRHRRERRKLLLLVTDGEPADVDERDPQTLRQDARKAVDELRESGVHTYCLTLDPLADQYVERIFGPGHYTIVDHLRRLPERLPLLFARLTQTP
ncbi:nitric oxide reductase activation protein NorD [Pararhodospirillum photometricum]|uniref:Rubisco activation protein CbbO, putative n=1 Tax=Pararhodospirillum photometricum DSM 122 TaxID=1150469 RepID=H6SPP1_PARPM|nr:VWA domain-containing protein [Pararhodospirillum photometricum]CCG07161.1 Rubisco activation protein CbbO, putative [Pararhodospirillum photometricum DSM 122]